MFPAPPPDDQPHSPRNLWHGGDPVFEFQPGGHVAPSWTAVRMPADECVIAPLPACCPSVLGEDWRRGYQCMRIDMPHLLAGCSGWSTWAQRYHR